MTEDRFGIPGLSVSARLTPEGTFIDLRPPRRRRGAHRPRRLRVHDHRAGRGARSLWRQRWAPTSTGIPAAWDAAEVAIVTYGESRWLAEHDVEHETWVA